MPVTNAAEAAERWKRNLGAAAQSYKEGVRAVTQSPTEKAAMAVGKYEAGVRRAVEDGTFVEGCRKVTLADWQQACASKGADRLVKGATEGAGKMQDFLSQFLPFAQQVSQQIDRMPSDTFEDRLARMVENARLLRQFKYNKRKGV